ncbi:MAG: hypothetical protein R6V50_01395 [Thermoplasmatota archaeon]
MKERNSLEINDRGCRPTCIPRCEKDIYYSKSLKEKNRGRKKMVNELDIDYSIETISEPLKKFQTFQKVAHKNYDSKDLEQNIQPKDYLDIVSSNIPKELISEDNYEEIKNIADNFRGSLTSFFGFETSLMDSQPRSDYLFAISSKFNEREELLTILERNGLPESLLKKRVWTNVKTFTKKWAEKDTIINNNILGLWFEFDAANTERDAEIPGIFTHTISIKKDSDIKWVFDDLLPLIKEKEAPSELKSKITDCVRKLPGNSSIYQIGIMLQRECNDIRLVIKRINHNEIIPYLKSIGWNDDSGKIQNLIKKLERYCSRIVLHISIGESIDSKIGLECSFYPDEKNQNEKWMKFFDFLVKNKYSKPDKIESILKFPGVEYGYGFSSDEEIITKMTDNYLNQKIIRFISHVKISYEPNSKIKSKAYFGVRNISEK